MSAAGLKNPLFFIGVIENNEDPRLEGRVQVRAFGVHGLIPDVPRDMLPWAIVAQGGYDPNAIPKVNSWVYGMFLDGRDAQQPMVLGLIPTQFADELNPAQNGWGWIPPGDGESLAHGSAPEDRGQPQQDRLARGEYIQDTYVLQQEMGRAVDVKIGGTDKTWDEPSSAYGAQYPHNRVIKTAHHSIELDDTPGAERIMIHHKSGSFVQIDSRGVKTDKTVSDKYEVIDRKQHVVVGGSSTVTILGNSYVYVKGNKIEEIEGDLQTKVRGNHLLSVGGQSNIIASEQVQIRAADVKVQANVGTMSLRAGKEMQISSGGLIGLPPKYGALTINSEKILINATDKLHMRGLTQVNIQSVAELNISAIMINQLATTWTTKATSTFISSTGNTDIDAGIDMAIGGSVQTNIGGAIVNVGSGFVNLAPPVPPRPSLAAGLSTIAAAKILLPPIGLNSIPFIPGSGTPEIGWYASAVVAPEPVQKSTSIAGPDEPGSIGGGGFSAKDYGGSDNSSGNSTIGNVSAVTQTAATPLLDFIGNKESEGYDDISGLVSRALYPAKQLTAMTIQEVLDWQESIDQGQLSEASGRYQIMEDTLRGFNNELGVGSGTNSLYGRAGLSAGDLFSPENQDKMAIVLLEGRGLSKFLAGTITREQFANNLASEWASLPLVTGPNAGRSKYAGDSAGNRSLTSTNAILSVIDQVKARSEAALEGSITTGGAR